MLLVLKFGGTSVGSAQRIKDLVKLTVNDTPKIVVLSAMSGTTNSLVEICNSLYSKNIKQATEQIGALKQKYYTEIKALYSNETCCKKQLI